MEVDLFRPGTVPISPETILWFEFLLDPELLLKHLQKPDPDPSPTNLITKFYDTVIDSLRNRPEYDPIEVINVEQDIDRHKQPAKCLALKILSLKVAAYLKWNLVQIRSLPFKTQINLLQDLMYFTNNKKIVEIPVIEEQSVETATPEYLFALLLFHRWLLNTSMHRITSNWSMRYSVNDMTLLDENIICCPENIGKTINFLTSSLDWKTAPNMLTFDCFVLRTDSEECMEFDWLKSQPISKDEFCVQINYDLGTFFFYREQYDLAKEHFLKCSQNFKGITNANGFHDVDRKMLEVYIHACLGSTEIHKGNLLEQLNMSIVNQYMGLISILQQDNIYREIPLLHRLNLELDIQGALSSGVFTVARDLLQKIKSLNIIRCILDRKPLYHYSNSFLKNTDLILWAIQCTWNAFNYRDKQRLKNFLLELVINEDVPDLLQKVQSMENMKNMFDRLDLRYVSNSQNKVKIPESFFETGIALDFSKKRKPKLELKFWEKRLILVNDHKEIREVLLKLAALNVSYSVWTINPQWELPIPLQSVVKGLTRGFLQDFAYVYLAKSKEHLLNRNYNLSLEFLIILQKELESSNCNTSKLFKLVSWEILLIQITQLLDNWPKNASTMKNALGEACEACLQTNDGVLPRTEIVEQCAICLLNLGRWEFLVSLDKRWTTFEITSAIALACQEIVKQKGAKKLPRNLWDIVLPIFVNSSQSKRNAPTYVESSRERNNLVSVVFKLKDTWCLSIVMSLLTRLFNILKDESGLEVQAEYMNLWPAVISNANSYNSGAVYELLSEVVTYALKENPTNIAWLRLMGDINFANGDYRIAISSYLKSLLIFYDYFNKPVRNDDHIFRRMIKCCSTLGCNTQAAVLCQFLEEVDYLLAFRFLSDQKTCNDAVDAYYHCFWDSNILEYLIHSHNKKGEYQRRKEAIQVIGMLELNSSNNEEIQREASNLRKSTFLRALCKQFVF